ncbi:MAG TPA: alpha/beta hydrolase, partial [Acidimicrobiales bacterium]|nr:alpha/beta hydrolase [Acidimicrobiales bacterium]
PDRLVLAGDSAGAQICSQVAAAITDGAYTRQLGIAPAVQAAQLRAVVLYCGFYDMRTFIDRGRAAPVPILRWGTRTMVRAYTGRAAVDSDDIRLMSVIDHATDRFPPAFISGGNGDPLTVSQSRPFSEKLSGLGVPVVTHFFDDGAQPPLPHEYQFDLDREEGRGALVAMLEFLRTHT